MQRILLAILTATLACACLTGQTAEVWTTGGATAERLQRWNDVTFTDNGTANAATITVAASERYQAIDGFGFTLTQASAKVLRGLPDWKRNDVLRDLYGPGGIGLSVVRVGIGATDLSEYAYTYSQQGPDPQLNGFSLAGPDLRDLVPVLREIVGINPQVKVLATPWSAPQWMKTNNSLVGGCLKPEYLGVYADYFLRYLEAMDAQGISIWAITPQNEPGHGGNLPSMVMSEAQQLAFVDLHLGPKLAASRFDPLIIGYDHNCDYSTTPINLLNGSDYFDGAAFHLYGGDIETMSQVYEATGKGVYFTEQFTGSNGDFNGDFGWHMENVVLGSLNNWSRTVLEWNLAADAQYGPYTSGGCNNCLPGITVANGEVTPNVSYYIIGQIAKFVPPGSVRLGTSSQNSDLIATAFQRPDGKRVVLVYNRSTASNTVRIRDGGRSFDQYIHGRAAITFIWNSGASAFSPAPAPAATERNPVYQNILSRLSGRGLDVASPALCEDENVQLYAVSGSGGPNQQWERIPAPRGGYHLVVRSSGMCLAEEFEGANNPTDNVVQRTCSEDGSKRWEVISAFGDYVNYRNVRSGKYLAVKDNVGGNGANVGVTRRSNQDAARWRAQHIPTNTTLRQPSAAGALAVQDVRVFPNPAHEELRTVLPPDHTYDRLWLLDPVGRVVREVAIGRNEPALRLDVKTLPPGLYWVRLRGDSGTVTVPFTKS